ncbi:MAG TPA: HlyD family secretion protein [Acetobacteraceae bacterium]|nr:HlyD family secretion protein [Acetobacteraceae bacterium]
MSSSTASSRDVLAAPARDRSRRGLRRLALAAAAAVLVAGGVWFGADWWTVGRFTESTDDAYVGGNVTGIAPHVGGFVAQVLVVDNDRVRAGQVLIRLDPRDAQAALDRAEAALATRTAALAGLHAQYLRQQASVRAREADLLAKSAEVRFTAVDAARYRILATASAASRQDEQRSSALDEEARAAVAAASAEVDAARQQLAVLAAEIAEAEASVAQARAELRAARLDLGYTEIRAPVDGYVGNRAAQVGAYVTAGTYLLSVVPAAGLWIDANFKEDQLARMRPGEAASVVADELPAHVFHGRIESLAHGTGAVFSIIPAENATGNFTKIVQRVPVRVALDPDDPLLPLLRPGLSTTVRIDTRGTAETTP